MPNHIHGVLEILTSGQVTPGAVVAFFKYQATRRINESVGTPGARQFQRGFYDRVIRGDREHFFIERYIELHPLLWDCDPGTPSSTPVSDGELRTRLRREFGLDEYSVERVLEQRSR